MSSKPRILIVEDESGIADTLQYVLRSDGFEPLWCQDAASALSSFKTQPPTLAILDVGLPDMNGFELFKQMQGHLRERGLPDLPMLFLTARSDEIDRVVGLELGADDYIAKPFSPRELMARVRSILRRSQRTVGNSVDACVQFDASAQTFAPPHKAQTAPFVVDAERMQIRYYGNVLELSRYEFGLLRALVQRPGRVFTREELLNQVWDQASESFDRTVDAHIKTLRAKLRAVVPGLDPIRTLRGTGYALNADLPATL